MGGPFVGRNAELEAISRVAAITKAGRGPAAVLVIGEAGQGKTRLFAEAERRLSIDHRFRVDGFETERGVPLAAARALIADLARTGDPMLAEVLAAPAVAGNRSLEPIRVFEAAHRTLDRLSPAAIVVDDVQWVDELSLALCHYLVRSAGATRRPVLLLAAGRPSAATTALRSSLDRLLPVDRLLVVELGAIRLEDGIALARSLQPGLIAADASGLWAAAGGSPFWIQTLAAAGTDAADQGDLIARRAVGLGEDALDVLRLVAIAGRPVSPTELRQLTSLRAGTLAACVEQLTGRGLVQRSAGLVSFTHDLVREAIAGGIPLVTQRELHRRIAAHLEDQAGDDIQTLRSALEHRRDGGLPLDDLAGRIARSPRRRWLGVDGMRELSTIVDALPASDPGAATLQADVASLASELNEHEFAFERWAALASSAPEEGARADAALAAAKEAFTLARREDVRIWLARGRKASGSNTAMQIELDALEAWVITFIDRRPVEGWVRSGRALRRARAVAARVGGIDQLGAKDRRAHLEAIRAGWLAALQGDRVDRMRELSDELFAVSRGFDESAQIEALNLSGLSSRAEQRFREAEAAFRRGWTLARERVLPGIAIDAGHWLALTLHDLGELPEAASVAADVADLVSRVGDFSRIRSRSRTAAHVIAFTTGEWRRGVDGLRATASGEPDPHARLSIHQELAVLLARVGGDAHRDDVVAQIALARDCAVQAGCPRCRLELELMSAEALVRIVRIDDAIAALRRWEAERPEPNPSDAFNRRWVGALVASETDGRAAGVEALAKFVEHAEGVERVVDSLWARLDLAKAMARFDRGAASREFRIVALKADSIGARTHRLIAEQELRTLGVRTWRRGASAGSSGSLGPLTDREREIAHILATGSSNPEIAAALFLSRKTIERHVSNVLAKLGARNRTEVAALVQAGGHGHAGQEAANDEGPHR